MIERDRYYENVRGDALVDELAKLAGIGSSLSRLGPKVQQAKSGLSAASRGRLAGAAIGAGLGGVAGGATDKENQTGGALRGAVMGGLAGLGAGQLSTGAGRQQVKRFGQRQLHGMTGYMPRTSQQRAGGIGWAGKGMSTDDRIKSLESIGVNVGKKVAPGGKAEAVQKAMDSQSIVKSLPKGVRRRLAQADVASSEAQRYAAETGLTSLPGVAKGLVTRPLKTMKAGFVSQGPTGMALAAVPAAMAVPSMAKGEGAGEGYSGPGGVGKFVGENIGYTALGAVPFAPMVAGAALAGKAGEVIHKGVQGRKAGTVAPQGYYRHD